MSEQPNDVDESEAGALRYLAEGPSPRVRVTPDQFGAVRPDAGAPHADASGEPEARPEPLGADAPDVTPVQGARWAAVGHLDVDYVRLEIAAANDPLRKGRLLQEAGEFEELYDNEAAAARDYLAAYNANPNFQEPLEGLVRLLERRRSLSDLGKLLETLVSAAHSPAERARALTARAAFLDDVEQNQQGALALLREAAALPVGPEEMGPVWLSIESLAARGADGALRSLALERRAELTSDPEWRGLLVVDAAEEAARAGDAARAAVLIEVAQAIRPVAWRAAVALETIADDAAAYHEASQDRAVLRGDALFRQARLLSDAMRDGGSGDEQGVPSDLRTDQEVADRLFRAACARREAGDVEAAGALLDDALAVLAGARKGERGENEPRGGSDGTGLLERIVLQARMLHAESAGDTARASELAKRLMEGEADGGVYASLAMRVAEHATRQGETDDALALLASGVDRDPTSAPLWARLFELLEGAELSEAHAEAIESFARQVSNESAKARLAVSAAYAWACRVFNARRAREALAWAERCGLSKELAARLGRFFADLTRDEVWYETSTQQLIEVFEGPETAFLRTECARSRLVQGDNAGAAHAVLAMRSRPESAWIELAIRGLAPGVFEVPDRALETASTESAIESLIASLTTVSSKQSLSMAGAMRSAASLDETRAIRHLEHVAEMDPGDSLVCAFLGDLLRRAGQRDKAAAVAERHAEFVGDPEMRVARHIECGLEAWARGDRGLACGHFETVKRGAPELGRDMVAWSVCGIDNDVVEGRRNMLDAAQKDASISLERFALEAHVGNDERAGRELAELGAAPTPALRLAAALGRLVWTSDHNTDEAIDEALALLGATSPEAHDAASAERFQRSLESGGDGLSQAREWFDDGGGIPSALEWLGASLAQADFNEEIEAKRALEALSTGSSAEAFGLSAALLEYALKQSPGSPTLAGDSDATKLANLELAPPGGDPERRAFGLAQLGSALGDTARLDALGLAGWSALASGDASAALRWFLEVTEAHPYDLCAWEGVRTAAHELGQQQTFALACEQLGSRCVSDARGAEFWEAAGTAWAAMGPEAAERAEAALEASFERDPTRHAAFDQLFRRVRDRGDSTKVLSLTERRLRVASAPAEIAKLHWERARALREHGDPDGALQALEHVASFNADHVGALALTGEILIRRGEFRQAAEKLAHLARVESAPAKNRVTASLAAADLYENKVDRQDLALEVLTALHEANLSTLAVRERLARSAARAGSWQQAASVLEILMHERHEPEQRIDAARLAMAISRDRLGSPEGAVRAAAKLLDEAPTDPEAIDVIASTSPATPGRRDFLERSRDALVMQLHSAPNDADTQRRLARVAGALGDAVLEQAALSCALALSGRDDALGRRLATLASGKPHVPKVALSTEMWECIIAPGDSGPVADLFVALGPTLAEALGPSRDSFGVSKRDRVDARSGISLRNEIAAWAGAFGIQAFELYVGGGDPTGIHGIAGEVPCIVVGASVHAPLTSAARAAVARELVGLARGSTIARWRDETALAAIAVAACNLAKVPIEHPPFAMLAEVERLMAKSITRKTRVAIEPLCRALAQSGHDTHPWAARARMSQCRAAIVASGNVAEVLSDLFHETAEGLAGIVQSDPRAHELLRFSLSRTYCELRLTLGLEH